VGRSQGNISAPPRNWYDSIIYYRVAETSNSSLYPSSLIFRSLRVLAELVLPRQRLHFPLDLIIMFTTSGPTLFPLWLSVCGVCDQKTSKFFVFCREESITGHVGINGVY
jgi:hypothetical protein